MAAETEFCQVLAVIQEKAAVGAVSLVTSETVSFLDWGMYQLLFPKCVVTLLAELGTLGGKPIAF